MQAAVFASKQTARQGLNTQNSPSHTLVASNQCTLKQFMSGSNLLRKKMKPSQTAGTASTAQLDVKSGEQA